jgi:hypothetical protein
VAKDQDGRELQACEVSKIKYADAYILDCAASAVLRPIVIYCAVCTLATRCPGLLGCMGRVKEVASMFVDCPSFQASSKRSLDFERFQDKHYSLDKLIPTTGSVLQIPSSVVSVAPQYILVVKAHTSPTSMGRHVLHHPKRGSQAPSIPRCFCQSPGCERARMKPNRLLHRRLVQQC